MTFEEQAHGSLASLPSMARQSSSTSFGSNPYGNINHGTPQPYISIMKDNLNFFMTRLLFMEEDKADSLQARRSTARMREVGNNSSGSLAFNDSRAAHDSQSNLLGVGGNGGPYDDDRMEEGVIVYQDNARILPNTIAKSMPPVPFPPAAPESPRAVEGKDGITMITPKHKRLESLPEALPLDDLSVGDYDDDDYDVDGEEYEEDLLDEYEEDPLEASQELLPPPEDHPDDLMDEDQTEETSKPPAKEPPKRKNSMKNKTPIPFVPPGQRVFPKNHPRRSLRSGSFNSKTNREEIKRSQSSRQMKEEAQATKTGANDDNLAKSLH